MEEVWRDVVGWEELYSISNLGNVWSKRNSKILKLTENRDGYLKAYLCSPHLKKRYFVHRLVASAFIINPKNKETVNHINGNKKDNNILNLEWSSRSENCQHAYDTGLQQKIKINRNRKLNEIQVLEIRRLYKDTDLSYVQIAKLFSVGKSIIGCICRRKIWKHV